MQSTSLIYNEQKHPAHSMHAPFEKIDQNNWIRRIFQMISVKQTVRPDSMTICCRQVIPYLKQSLIQGCWKLFFVFKKFLNIQENPDFLNKVVAIEALYRLHDAIIYQSEKEVKFTDKEINFIKQFLSSPLPESDYFKLNAYLFFLGKDKLWKTLKTCQELFKPFQENCIESIEVKLKNIQQSLSTGKSFSDADKLNPKDVRLLMVASDRKKFLQTLKTSHIYFPHLEELLTKWMLLEELNVGSTTQYLREVCLKMHSCGRVFFYDWSFIEIRDLFSFGLKDAFKHVLYSRIPHVAIVVQDSKDQLFFSHVNAATGGHALHPNPMKYPLLGALGNFVDLDILPLIPSVVSQEHRDELQHCFSKAFVKYASEEHPNITLKWKMMLTFFLGHMGVKSHDFSEINLSAKQSQMCSSYVFLIFLKAIDETNLELEKMGYKVKIKYPIGRHEIIDRVDILRLLYHWKRLKVMKVVSNPTISKFFTTSPI